MSLNVLIVENEFLIAMELDAKLCDLGHTPVGFADSVARTMERADGSVDLALVDVGLTDGETGAVIGQSLAQEYGIKVIYITGDAGKLGDGVQGTIEVIQKPISKTTLAEVLVYIERLGGSDQIAAPEALRLFG